jgi:hypothetical protein
VDSNSLTEFLSPTLGYTMAFDVPTLPL